MLVQGAPEKEEIARASLKAADTGAAAAEAHLKDVAETEAAARSANELNEKRLVMATALEVSALQGMSAEALQAELKTRGATAQWDAAKGKSVLVERLKVRRCPCMPCMDSEMKSTAAKPC